MILLQLAVLFLESLDPVSVLIIQIAGFGKLALEKLHLTFELRVALLKSLDSLGLAVDGGAHVFDLVPIVWVVTHHLDLEVKQVDLVLGLENGHLARLALQLHLRRFQLLDLTLSDHPAILDFFCLVGDRFELLLDLALLHLYLFQLNAQLTCQHLMLVHFLFFLFQLVLHHGQFYTCLCDHLIDHFLLLLRHRCIYHLYARFFCLTLL